MVGLGLHKFSQPSHHQRGPTSETHQVGCILCACLRHVKKITTRCLCQPPPSPSHTKFTIQKIVYPIFFFQINNVSNPNSYKNKIKIKDQNLYKLSFGVNFGSSSSQRSVLNFGSEAGSSLWFRNFLLKIYNQWSRYLLTGPKNGIGPKPEPDNTGKWTTLVNIPTLWFL
jgi:hypothetical protein